MDLQLIRTRHPPQAYLDQFAELNTSAGMPVSLEQVRERLTSLSEEDRLILALQSELLIGYAHLRVARDLVNDETAEVAAIIVRPSYRRRGVGRQLINAAETWAQQSGRARLLLRTDVVRTEAHAFFVALGYEELATTVDFVRNLERKRKSEQPTQPRA
jgi:GNAT superfamily N-acetyltransferase